MICRLMRRVSFAAVIVVAAIPGGPLALHAQSKTPPNGGEAKTPTCESAKLSCTNGLCRLELQFPATDKCLLRIDDAFIRKQAGASRITEKTTLRIRVLNANLLRYAIGFQTRETVIESYVFLEKLWKQILGLGALTPALRPGAATADPRDETFVAAINAWRTGLDTEAAWVTKSVGEYKELTLNATQQKGIADAIATLETRLNGLITLQTGAREKITLVEHFAVYDETLKTHQAIVDKLEAFGALGAQIAVGFDKKIDFGTAGRVVAVTITATDKATAKEQTQIIGVEFLVHSTLPVTFHAGFTVRALKELRFEAVGSSIQTAGGADLFAKVQDSGANATFTAFMSYRPCNMSRANRCPHLTIGTEFKGVGDRLYAGLSWPIGRAFITLGAVNGESEEAKGPVTDLLGAAGQVTGSRELFTVIGTKRRWGGFAGLSFAPF